jgi:beta-lactamase regulating signal transducer with metallopeptidase domain
MHLLLVYILKLSVSLAVVFLFYHFILRKLTFYNHNRWYLLGYTMLSFIIPFINVAALLQKNNWQSNEVINWVPIFKYNTMQGLVQANAAAFNIGDVVIIIIAAGAFVMLCRLLLHVFSFKKMLYKAEQVTTNGMSLYQVNENIIPFSFGNSIFINRHLHSEAELQEIIRHEFVHVKQRHSIDIIWAELLCACNWYNPFVWLLKKSIRQNLEFIADNKVLENGINKKEYQYLLLKVIGNNKYSIANQFNFSSLKKRIAMMNKTKSAKRQLVRLLFLLPATAVLLLAFRGNWNAAGKTATANKKVAVAGIVVDAKTLQPLAGVNIYCKEKNISLVTDEKGYYLLQLPFENKPLQFTLLVTKNGYQPYYQKENWGNFNEDYIFNRYSKAIEYFGLSKSMGGGFSSLGSAADMDGLEYDKVAAKLEDVFDKNSPGYDATATKDTIVKPNSKGYIIDIVDCMRNCKVVIKDKTGKEIKRILMTEWNKNEEKYEAIYGEIPPPPPPPEPPMAPEPPEPLDMPLPPAPPAPPVADAIPEPPPMPPPPPEPLKLPANVKRLDLKNNKATILLKNGKQENYDFNIDAQKADFEKKYGKIHKAAAAPAKLNGQAAPVSINVKDENKNSNFSFNSGHNNNTSQTLPQNLLYVLDGVIVDKTAFEKVKPESIAAIDVLKGSTAIAKYGDKAKEGAILVTTKTADITINAAEVRRVNNSLTAKSSIIEMTDEKRLVLLDGKELPANRKKLAGSFNIVTLNKTDAVKKYGDKGKNGVIEITTVK